MDPDTGKIYDESMLKDLTPMPENLVPFELGEPITFKGCFFEIVGISPDPYNYLMLSALEKEDYPNIKAKWDEKYKE